MKKVISLLLCMVMAFSLFACSASKLTAYEPTYGEELSLNDKLEYKEEYKKNISKETREAIAAYLQSMVIFYNSVDTSVPQTTYFTYYMYTISNNFIDEMDALAEPLLDKQNKGEELTSQQQLFWDMIMQVYAVPVQLDTISSEAYNTAYEALAEKAEEGAEIKVESITITDQQWEKLYDTIVKTFDMLYTTPFAK